MDGKSESIWDRFSHTVGLVKGAETGDVACDMGWEIWPDRFYELLMRISREYKSMPMEITENGASYLDGPDSHGKIPDTRRVEYLRGYLSAFGRAMKDGASICGYHCWSLLDNFEWAEGYTQRFGLAYMD